jgi:uncharacterized protein (DUF1501 family)
VNRRLFLSAILGTAAGRLWAAPGNARFLLVFLRGGYDAANVLVPVSSADYYEARPNIAIRKDQCLEIDGDWGLHPALRDSLHPLYRKGELAFVPFAGSENLSRSHFETQDAIELGEQKNYGSGFLNRLVSLLGGGSAISFTNQMPLVFRGEAPVANAALRFAGRSGVDARQSQMIEEMYRGTPLSSPVSEGFAARDKLMGEIGQEMQAAGRNAPNARNFELEARRVARLMRSSYRVGFVDVGGWDTHVAQGGAEGQLALRLQQLGGGLAAFAAEMGPAWRETVVVVISEFGRTFRENGNRGTDHGHGSVYWLLGGAVRGGRVAGEQVRVARGTLFQDRDYPVLNEYRGLLGGLLGRMYGLSDAELEKVFPGAKPVDLALA